jgi:glycosyltransferase involved in cell wall biosynthesis
VPTYNVGFGEKYSRTQGKWKYPLSLLRARHLIKKLKPDILHTHYVTSGGLAALICGFHPVITTVHGSDINVGIKSPIWKYLLETIFRNVDCINTCTEDQKRKVISFGIRPEKIKVVNPGVDSEMFSFCAPKPIENRPLRLVTTRSLEPIYDNTTIIKALSFVRDKKRDFIMTFVAGGSMLNELKNQVDKEGLTENVRFLGGVDKNQIVGILHENDVFISSPIYDGISIALLEAMSVGLFPVASDIEVNSNWIEHGVEGFLHKTSDPQSLANCILETYDSPQLIISAANRNRQKILELADTTTNMKKIENIYKDLIDKK